MASSTGHGPPTPSQLLAELLLGDVGRASSSARQTADRDLWNNAVSLAGLWRVVPQLSARVRRLEPGLPPEVARRLGRAAAAAAAQSALICHRGAEALDALERRGIAAAAFKGVATIAALHRAPGKRMLGDVDLLVAGGARADALVALGELGFAPAPTIDLGRWLRLLDERVYPLHDYLELTDDAGVTIDLHWRISTAATGGLSTEELVGRSVVAPLLGRPVRIVAPEDSILLTAYHALRDHLAPASAVKDLCDLGGWLAAETPAWSVEATTRRARRCGLGRALLAAWRILAELDRGSAARDAARRLGGELDRGDRRSARRLAELFWHQLREGPASEALLGLSGATPALVGRFVVSRLRSLLSAEYGAQKFGHRPEVSWRQRLGRLARELLALRPAAWAGYRAMAREQRALIAVARRRGGSGPVSPVGRGG